MDFRNEFMQRFFEEIAPLEFYREIFPIGELQAAGVYNDHKCNGIAVEIGKDKINRYTITDDLSTIEKLLSSKEFVITSPISYVGKSRTSENARFMYALAFDLDGVNEEESLVDLFHQMDKAEFLPRPTFIVTSGNGLHLYYVFEKPIPLFRNIAVQLTRLKHDITKRLWNGYVTDLSDKVQYQSIFQGFRMVGGVTKKGGTTKAYRTGERVTIDYMNQFVFHADNKVTDFAYKSDLTLSQAKEKYPDWYEKRIVEKKRKGTWTCDRAVYDWWKMRLYEIVEGHRYYGLMCLAIYAKKCGISREELEKDAYGLVDRLDLLTNREDNHFTIADAACAIELFNDNYITFPIDTISKLTDITIKKNKRNGRKRADHIKMMNFIRDELEQNTTWNKVGNGRKKGQSKQRDIVEQWQQANPQGRKCDCMRDTGLSKPTVYKWWNNHIET